MGADEGGEENGDAANGAGSNEGRRGSSEMEAHGNSEHVHKRLAENLMQGNTATTNRVVGANTEPVAA